MDNKRRNNRRDSRNNNRRNGGKRLDRKVINIRRVAKVTSGGRRLRFSAMVVVGDKNGSVGVGLGRGSDTRAAIEKGARIAEKKMIKIQTVGDTIPHEITVKKGAAKVMLRPAKVGTGVIAGSSVRIVLEAAGIENVYGKILGSSDLVANTYTAYQALKQLRNKRVLKKMQIMKDRIDIKAQMDKDRKEKERRLRAKQAKENGNDNRNGRGGRRNGRNNRNNRNNKGRNQGPKQEASKKIEEKEVKKETAPKAEKKEVKKEEK